ncbi:hypothetical protein PV416_31395 [Streptomyces ipomoeae]|nr:hypothetical protein [Streptomyces ipomoeae]MDX2697432.1 hypothetical protein [Streptomyces ipomoeae]MDX2825460.1 hypothetical protein [Streptomyces ipomoeae]MDX2843194.1 hypothetical protein [Streptomyces ipomoeae]
MRHGGPHRLPAYTTRVASRLRPEGAPDQCDHPGFGTPLFSL